MICPTSEPRPLRSPLHRHRCQQRIRHLRPHRHRRPTRVWIHWNQSAPGERAAV